MSSPSQGTSTQEQHPTPKKKGIRFSAAGDVLLLKAVTAVDEHIAPHGGTQTRFEETLYLFVSSAHAGRLKNMCAPSWQTFNDRFKKVFSDHRLAARNNAVAYGIIEVRREREMLLGDIVLSMDEWDEERRSERDAETELDERLMEAREEIKAKEITRKKGCAEDEDESPSKSRKTKKRRELAIDSDEEKQDQISDQIAAHGEPELNRFKLEEERLLL